MITVIDSGGANLASVLFALDRLGIPNQLSRDKETIRTSPKVILPGVGAAATVMSYLEERDLLDCVRKLTQPVLGICLGMQILFQHSSEGHVDCLGILPGRVSLIEPRPGFPVPHMGWNQVQRTSDSKLLPASEDGAHFYFVHSYFAPLSPFIKATADYGGPIPAIVEHKNFFGVQFHPERSGEAGQRLLKRFAEEI